MIEALIASATAPTLAALGPWAVLALAVHGLAVAVVNLTPTPKDDAVLASIYKGVEILAGIVTPLAKK